MRFLSALTLLVPAVSFGQIDLYRELESGTPTSWPATTISYTYDIPEPVGPIDLSFRVQIEPITLDSSNGIDHLRLVAGRVTFRGMGIIDLPASILTCLPRPRPQEAGFQTLYIDASDSGRPWPEEFTIYVEIPFGRPSTLAYSGLVFSEYPTVEFRITGGAMRRAAFRTATGEVRTVQDVSDSCPQDLVDWASPPTVDVQLPSEAILE